MYMSSCLPWIIYSDAETQDETQDCVVLCGRLLCRDTAGARGGVMPPAGRTPGPDGMWDAGD